MGPLVSLQHRDRVASYIGAGEGAGAKVIVDGRDEMERDGSSAARCSLLDHVTPEMSVWTDEIFGPVLSIERVDTYARRSRSSTATSTGDPVDAPWVVSAEELDLAIDVLAKARAATR